MYKKLSILIPIYNEKETIQPLLEKIRNVSLESVGLKKEIIIVDDSSTDGTKDVLAAITDNNIEIYYHSKNSGKGTAIRTALQHATGDIVIIQDADLEYDPMDYIKLIRPIVLEETSVVYGSRILKKSNQRHSGLSFYLGGLFITLFTNLLYHMRLTDEPTCYKVFKTDIIKGLNLTCKRFEFCPEVTAKIAKKGIKIHEVPISYYPRSKTKGKKIRWRDGLYAIWVLLKYRFKN